MVDEFIEQLMATLLCAKDTCAHLNLHMSVNAAKKVPPLMTSTRDDEAAGLPVTSIALAYSKKGILSPLEDELSLDGTPLVEGIVTKPTNEVLNTSTHTGMIKHDTKSHIT